MKNYLIQLTPVAPFFFAGEKNFGDNQEANYFAKSNIFPQQTSILGMLRKELLIQDNIYKENWNYSEDEKTRSIDLIGEKSFQIENNNTDFGKIGKISPVFLVKTDEKDKGNQYLITAPKDKDLVFTKEKSGKTNLNLTKNKDFIPVIKNFNPKKGLPNTFIFSSDTEKNIAFNDIFKKFIKVGNAKDKTDGDEEKFFKQVFYTMEKGFSFAFFAQIDFELNNFNSIVYMGGDNSSFKIEVKQSKKTFQEIFINRKSQNDKITLLSDAYVDEEIYDYCEFAITETMDFRTLNISQNGIYKNRNEKYVMLKRGSVFFTNNKPELIKKISENKALEKIGYNIFQ